MAQYLIQDTTLVNIADAIRSKTDSTDAIKVSDMATQIEGITGGGGIVSEEELARVTFCNYDGTVLYQRYVFIGDDCTDPVKQGKIARPTKIVDGTALDWTGWNIAPDIAEDPNALSNITSDRTLYASFRLVGTLDNVSWAEISAASLDGTASSKFKKGDTKRITITNSNGTTEEILVAIAGFNLHQNTNGTRDGITFIQKGHRTATVSHSNGMTSVNNTYNLLEDDLKAVIRQSKITSMVGYTKDDGITTTTDDLYVFAPELNNISPSLTNASGGTGMTVSIFGISITMSQGSTYDPGQFPLFVGMSNAQIGQFLGLTSSGARVATRTKLYGKANTIYSAVAAQIAYNATYSVIKYANDSASSAFQFCFRV